MENINGQLNRRQFLKRTSRATVAVAALAAIDSVVAPLLARAGGAARPDASRISYYCNGEIQINRVGTPDGKPITTGHWDFKPSWSKTGNKLVFFRRLKDDPVTVNWITAIGVINVDGTGFHELTDGTHTDFNPTWTRDGLNTPIWNRKNSATGTFFVVQGSVGQSPGQEITIGAESCHTWAYSSLIDGRILVSCMHPAKGWGYYLMTREAGGAPHYEGLDCELAKSGLLDRVSVSPSETKLCFEFQSGFKYKDPGRTLYIADFDAKRHTITNVKAIANREERQIWYAYPRWIQGEATVVYHSYETGKGQLYVYHLKEGTTERVSRNPDADYRYPHGEAAPC